MKKLFFAVAISGSILWLASCETTPDDYQTDLGYEYFPLEVGKFIVYEVDSTIYDPTGDSMVFSSKTLVKEEVVDTLSDNNGETLFKIERYQRSADTLPWLVTKVFTASIQDDKAVQTEDNLRFIKIVFPAKKNATWDGNVHFNSSLIVTVAGESLEMFKDWVYKIESTDEQETIGDLTFGEVLTVQEADNENLIELRRSKVKYSKGIGLIYRELWILDTQCIEQCDGQTWEEKAEKGFILKQQIIAHN